MGVRDYIRKQVNSGALGWMFPDDMAIKTCVEWATYRYERPTVDYLKTLLRPGDAVLDIGAHIGYYARLCSRRIKSNGKVYAFEPHPKNIQLLESNCRRCSNVQIVAKAVAGKSGRNRFYEHCSSSTGHALADISQGGHYFDVDVVSIDDWMAENKIENLTAVIIDVEGFEHEVLSGMHETLKRNPNLHVIIEYCPDNYSAMGVDMATYYTAIEASGLRIVKALGLIGTYTVPAGVTFEQQIACIEEQFSIRHDSEYYFNLVLERNR